MSFFQTFGETLKIDVRVGTIETVDDVPKSNKLIKLTDTGIGCA
jgi:tRNA-binding EMAP/Myf-like protein